MNPCTCLAKEALARSATETAASWQVSLRRPLLQHQSRQRLLSALTWLVLAFLLEVAEDGAWIDAEITRGLGPVAVVHREHLVDVLALPAVLGRRQRQDLREHVGG